MRTVNIIRRQPHLCSEGVDFLVKIYSLIIMANSSLLSSRQATLQLYNYSDVQDVLTYTSSLKLHNFAGTPSVLIDIAERIRIFLAKNLS